MFDDWRKRIEAGARRHPAGARAALLERLLIAHESYEEIMESWAAEAQRRVKESDAGEVEGLPLEVALAGMREQIAASASWQPPPVPEDIEDIEDQALHLTHDDFYALLVNVEAELPPGVDPDWRADIRARIQAVPAEIGRRYREQEERGGSAAEREQVHDTPDLP
jgi:hypothetical protein